MPTPFITWPTNIAASSTSPRCSHADALHHVAYEHRGDVLLAAFESLHRDPCNLVRHLWLIVFLEHHGQGWFELVFVFVARCEDAHGVNGVDFDIGLRCTGRGFGAS